MYTFAPSSTPSMIFSINVWFCDHQNPLLHKDQHRCVDVPHPRNSLEGGGGCRQPWRVQPTVFVAFGGRIPPSVQPEITSSDSMSFLGQFSLSCARTATRRTRTGWLERTGILHTRGRVQTAALQQPRVRQVVGVVSKLISSHWDEVQSHPQPASEFLTFRRGKEERPFPPISSWFAFVWNLCKTPLPRVFPFVCDLRSTMIHAFFWNIFWRPWK